MDDHSASILLQLKNSSDDSPSPIGTDIPLEDGTCPLNTCLLCSRGVPCLLVRSPTWASIMRVVFYCLQHDNSTKYFFNLKTDVYGFMTTHWKKLCLDKKRSDNWHKQIQDMLSHSKNLFESGMERYKQNGFWRMKQTQDPWTIRKDRKSNKLKRAAGDINEPDSPGRKRLRKDDSSDSADEIDLQIEVSDERRRALEEEVRNLKTTLSSMTQDFNMMKEELKKRDQEVNEKTMLYYQLLEQFKLQQQQAPCSPNRGHHPEDILTPKQWDSLRPDFGNQYNSNQSQLRFYPFPRNILSPTSPNKYITEEDDEYFTNHSEVQVPQLMRFSMTNHL